MSITFFVTSKPFKQTLMTMYKSQSEDVDMPYRSIRSLVVDIIILIIYSLNDNQNVLFRHTRVALHLLVK